MSTSKPRIAALILAAGSGRRLSGRAKALLHWGDRTFLQSTVEELRLAGVAPLRVVTGAYHTEVEAEARRLNITSVHNEDHLNGMQSSIQAGLRSLDSEWEAVLICLVDQPLLIADDFRRLIDAFRSEKFDLIRPSYSGVPGNPALISRKYKDEILAEPAGDYGCAYLFTRHPAATRLVLTPSPSCRIDIDQPEDYAQITRS